MGLANWLQGFFTDRHAFVIKSDTIGHVFLPGQEVKVNDGKWVYVIYLDPPSGAKWMGVGVATP